MPTNSGGRLNNDINLFTKNTSSINNNGMINTLTKIEASELVDDEKLFKGFERAHSKDNITYGDIDSMNAHMIETNVGILNEAQNSIVQPSAVYVSNVFQVDISSIGLKSFKGPGEKSNTNYEQMPAPQINNWMIESFIPRGPIDNNNKKPAPLKPTFIGGQCTQFNKDFEECKKLPEGEKFCDKNFGNDITSLWGFGKDASGYNEEQYKKKNFEKMTWMRLTDMEGGEKACIWKNKVEPNDVQQGGIGDCYYLVGLSTLCQYPQIIENIFLTKEVNQYGCYCIALCINGAWESVTLDDRFPYDAEAQSWAFTYTNDMQLWSMLLEKAWAKIHGGFLNIDGGQACEAFSCLTGAPTLDYFIQSKVISYKKNL